MYRQHIFALPLVQSIVNETGQTRLLTYNLELSTGIHRSMLILCHTLIHPRV